MLEMIYLGHNFSIEEELLNSLKNEETKRLPLFCSPEELEKNVWRYELHTDQGKVREDWCRVFETRIRKNGSSYFVDLIDFGRYPDDRPEIVRVSLEKKDGEYKTIKNYHFL